MTKIDVVSGFLGAGKTTLIKKLLKEALDGSKTVLIENEFGEIGIDGGFLKEAGIEIKEMNSGCICCSLVGDFGTSLKEVISTYAPERILIEPSGVGKLSDVLKAVENVAGDLDVEINSAVAVVDASKCKMYMKNFGEFFSNQIEYAGTIILSRTDKVDQAKLNACVEMIREHNDKATIITTPLAQLDGKEVLGTIEGADKLEDMMKEMLEHIHDDHDEDECCDHEHHHHHDHDEDDHDHECCCGHHHDDDDDEDEHAATRHPRGGPAKEPPHVLPSPAFSSHALPSRRHRARLTTTPTTPASRANAASTRKTSPASRPQRPAGMPSASPSSPTRSAGTTRRKTPCRRSTTATTSTSCSTRETCRISG